jgi:hypothetical protein
LADFSAAHAASRAAARQRRITSNDNTNALNSSLTSASSAHPVTTGNVNPKRPTVSARTNPTTVPSISTTQPSATTTSRVATSATASTSAAIACTKKSGPTVATCR